MLNRWEIANLIGNTVWIHQTINNEHIVIRIIISHFFNTPNTDESGIYILLLLTFNLAKQRQTYQLYFFQVHWIYEYGYGKIRDNPKDPNGRMERRLVKTNGRIEKGFHLDILSKSYITPRRTRQEVHLTHLPMNQSRSYLHW